MREDTVIRSTFEMNQRSFASAEYAMKKKRTRRAKSALKAQGKAQGESAEAAPAEAPKKRTRKKKAAA